jgi:ribosomal protein L16 Arg81 hydroxylase
MHAGETASGLERSFTEMRGGATLVLDSLHQHDAKLGLLCRLLDQQLGHRHQTNLYLTPPNGQGFTPHWDNHDVFILQVMGSKHWRVEKQHRRKLPFHDEKILDEARQLVGERDAFTLNQGDMVYIPRGYVHAAECGPEPSLHITLGMVPFTWAELLQAMTKAAIQKDDRLRAALPLGFIGADTTKLMNGALAALREMADKAFLTGVLDQYVDEVVSKFPLDVSGQISDFFRPQQLKLEDVIGPRRGVVCKVHDESETVRINVGARSITFPEFF